MIIKLIRDTLSASFIGILISLAFITILIVFLAKIATNILDKIEFPK